MGSSTFVQVVDEQWRFDVEGFLAALTARDPAPPLHRQGSTLTASDWDRGWEVTVLDDLATVVIGAPPASMIELVAWVRGFVPAKVRLQIFEEQLSFDPAPLPPGITPEEVRAQFFPEAWKVEQMSRKEPPTLAERMQATKPPHIP